MVDYITELLVDGEWMNITSDVRDSSPIIMERGRRDWATETDPATCSLKLNNGSSKAAAGVRGRYSPRNPRSDLFGKIGRNTQLRVRRDFTAGQRESFLVLPGVESSYARTADNAALDITGNLELRLSFNPTTWRPDTDYGLARKYDLNSDERSWALLLDTTGVLYFRWSPDGTITNAITVFSEDPIPDDSGPLSIRIRLDVNNGAAGNDVYFDTSATSIDGPWTALGGIVTNAGVTSVHSGTAPVEVGRVNDPEGTGIFSTPLEGEVYEFRLYNSAVAQVANPNFTLLEPGTTAWDDNAGRPWSLRGSATLVDTSIRFTGEVYTWPPEWDLSGADHWVNITAAGITRRLQKGKKPAKSSLYRDLSTKADVVAYWPLEDVKGASQFNAGRADDLSFLEAQTPSEITLAGDDETFFASAPLPTVGAGRIAGQIPFYSADADQRLVFLVSIPADVTWATEKVLFTLGTSGTVKRWIISKSAGDNIRVRAYDADNTNVEDTSYAMAFFGVPCAFSLWLEQDGGAIVYQISIFPLDGSTALAASGGIASSTVGRMTWLGLGGSSDIEGTTFGHTFILNDDVQSIWDTIRNAMVGWTGETGLERLVRLSEDAGLPGVRSIGTNNSEAMGPQLIKTQMELFREVPTADLGLLTDRPDTLGLQYRSRTDLYSQAPILTLDYSSGVIAEPFRSVEDDQNIVNEVTVERPRGSSFTATDTTGPLSSLDPPDGVGLYDIKQEINIESDDRLAAQAYWRLHLGTIDEARFPVVGLNLRNPRAEALVEEVLAITEGDIIRIENPPDNLPGGPYDLLVEAIREEKTAVEHIIEFACSPGAAWSALMLDDDDYSRLDTGGSTLGETLTATQTVFDVVTAPGSQVWINSAAFAAHFPFDIIVAGEAMRVTAITGTSSPQEFTVLRAVNGVAKAQAIGAAVTLAKPIYLSL